MSIALAAVGAVVVALLETSVAPFLIVSGARPDLVFTSAVVATVTIGAQTGYTWAFVGGLMLDLLSAPVRPLGATTLALLVAVGLAAVAARFLGRSRPVTAVAATFLLTFVYQLLFLGLLAAMAGPVTVADPVGPVLPIAVENTVLSVPLALLGQWLWTRFAAHDRIDW
jgi:rod shape-determining protein MreD